MKKILIVLSAIISGALTFAIIGLVKHRKAEELVEVVED